MKVYERVLKSCLGRKITVRYGRCSSRYGVSKCSLTGILLAHDNLCIVMGSIDKQGESLTGITVINKNEIESIFIDDKSVLRRIGKALAEACREDENEKD